MKTPLFCNVDDFYHYFIPQWESTQIESKEKTQKSTCVADSDFIFFLLSRIHKFLKLDSFQIILRRLIKRGLSALKRINIIKNFIQ